MLWLSAQAQPTPHKHAAHMFSLHHSGHQRYKVENFDSEL